MSEDHQVVPVGEFAGYGTGKLAYFWLSELLAGAFLPAQGFGEFCRWSSSCSCQVCYGTAEMGGATSVLPELVSSDSFLVMAAGGPSTGGRVSRRADLRITAFIYWTMPGATQATAFSLVKYALHPVPARPVRTNKRKRRRLRRALSAGSPWAPRVSWHGARGGHERHINFSITRRRNACRHSIAL